MAVDPLPALAAFAGVIALGFLGYLLFERTRITDVLILIGFGVVVGPWLHVFDPASLAAASALVGTLALIVIMFDGGLGLDIKDLATGIARSTILAIVGFLFTVVTITGVGIYWLELDVATAALLGCILGGTSGIIVMPIITRASAAPATRVLLSVESALTDVLCVIGAFTLMGILQQADGAVGAGDVQVALKNIAAQFSVAIVVGLVLGLVWLRLLKTLETRKFSYMLTLAAILGLYVTAEVAGGNGAISVLIFGVVLGNGRLLAAKLDMEGLALSDNQRQFQGEVAFLIRAFFFVYLGMILDPAILVDPTFLAGGAFLLAAILVARIAAVGIATFRDQETAAERNLVMFLMPRGLAATVLAGLPLQAGIPGTESFLAYAFVVVAATNLVGTITIVAHERSRRRTVPVGGTAPAPAPRARVR